jgi:hypothetical protein
MGADLPEVLVRMCEGAPIAWPVADAPGHDATDQGDEADE